MSTSDDKAFLFRVAAGSLLLGLAGAVVCAGEVGLLLNGKETWGNVVVECRR